jgi:hypothetical protein
MAPRPAWRMAILTIAQARSEAEIKSRARKVDSAPLSAVPSGRGVQFGLHSEIASNQEVANQIALQLPVKTIARTPSQFKSILHNSS